jgi:NAD(P)-dependent dehydrogenase (short-subunit alcohol dehydrogenase family)
VTEPVLAPVGPRWWAAAMNDNAAVALVTGANKGIGFEIVRQLAERGMTVFLAARDPERRDRATAALRSAGLDVRPVTLDVTGPATIEAAAAHVGADVGRLDVLVNNAGVSGSGLGTGSPGNANLDAVKTVFDTNVFGVLRVTNAMLPLLRRSPMARIVNVSSGVGSMTYMTNPDHYMSRLPAVAAYPASKAALNALTVQYAKELRADGILVNAAAPGACATDFTRNLAMTITRSAADGAAIAVKLATLGPDGPSGGFFDDDGPVPW